MIGAHLSIRKENEGLEDEAGDSTLEDSYAWNLVFRHDVIRTENPPPVCPSSAISCDRLFKTDREATGWSRVCRRAQLEGTG